MTIYHHNINNNKDGGGGMKWSHIRNTFLPEESFRSWGNYARALKDTPFRFKDRLLARSSDTTELLEMKALSRHDMKKSLNWWDLLWFGIGAVIGSNVFILTGLEAKYHVGPAVVIAYFFSGVSAMLSVFCYTEFAVDIPVAGSSFAYLRVELGDFISFIAAGNILLEYVVGGPAFARAWTYYFAALCNHKPDDFRITVDALPEDYNHLDPIAVLVLLFISLLTLTTTKGSSRLNSIASIFHLLAILVIIVAGLVNANPKNYTPFTVPFGAGGGIFRASKVVFFSYVGFEAVPTMAEETENPGRDIPIGLIGSMFIATCLYCLLAITLCLMQPYNQINTNDPFSLAFETVGMGWAKYLIAAAALKGITSVLLVAALGQARYLTHIARTQMMPSWLARVNERTGTPVNATLTMLTANAFIALFTSLDDLSNLLSIATLFIFMLVAVALLIRRYFVAGVTTKLDRIKLIVCLVLILGSSSTASATYWGLNNQNENGGGCWIGYVVSMPFWLIGTVGLWVFVPQARSPKLWGVPLVPWLPSASIGINIFFLGSVDVNSFIRFAVRTGIVLVYYLLVGVHASFDKAKEYEKKRIKELHHDTNPFEKNLQQLPPVVPLGTA
ncbi:cationic amino acid transporter 1-like isoform X2 [Ziziphus jujuba]|uniref:Cationic amino acid transporter 1-like isoform X2 n=1 Tax=Ziziphus jujuba TaxID=326968 RepID=A0ABM3I6T0_ZIZJJ|nr:cationic amino acid transporter 1-like isoform X2 [Ziziphus jujuba]